MKKEKHNNLYILLFINENTTMWGKSTQPKNINKRKTKPENQTEKKLELLKLY